MGDAASFDQRLKKRIGLIIVASIGMSLLLLTLVWLLGTAATSALGLTILVLSGIAGYFIIGHVIGAFRLSEFRNALRRS